MLILIQRMIKTMVTIVVDHLIMVIEHRTTATDHLAMIVHHLTTVAATAVTIVIDQTLGALAITVAIMANLATEIEAILEVDK